MFIQLNGAFSSCFEMSTTVVITIVEFLFVAGGCWLLLRHYQSRSVTWDVSVSVFLSWVLGFATVLLLPYDLSLALTAEPESTSLLTMWKVVYWR